MVKFKIHSPVAVTADHYVTNRALIVCVKGGSGVGRSEGKWKGRRVRAKVLSLSLSLSLSLISILISPLSTKHNYYTPPHAYSITSNSSIPQLSHTDILTSAAFSLPVSNTDRIIDADPITL